MGKILALLVLASLTVVPEAKGWWFMDKFDWLPSECAHKQYPMRLIQGDLLLKDGSSLYVPASAVIDNGWGELGSTDIVGSPLKSLPVKLRATWFSFAEDKFFTGEFTLPYDLILDLFKKGLLSPVTGKKATYNRIFVGFGPEGALSVWVAGDGVVLEVAKYKGREIILPWTAVTGATMPRKDYIALVLEDGRTAQELHDLKEHGVPIGVSDRHSTQYLWNVSLPRHKNQVLWLKTLNGEREHFDFATPSATRSRGLPQKIDYYWENQPGQKYVARMTFDDSEITAAFRKLAEKNGSPMQLKLEISDEPHIIHTSLSDGKYIIRLNKTEGKVFTRR